MVPEYHRGSLIFAEHLTRYQSALPFVADKVVLDIASGSGYGTKLLAEAAAQAYGVDADAGAVDYARTKFSAANVEFRHGDAVAIPLDDNSVDVVVSFETIEHIENYRRFMGEIKRVLRPNGIALISTPNDLEFAEGNHYHLHEFVYQELLDLVGEYFRHTDSYFQGTWKYVAVGTEQVLSNEGEIPCPTSNLAPLSREKMLYFYLVCSDAPIMTEAASTAAVGQHYSDRDLAEHERNVQGIREVHDRLVERVEALEQARLGLVAERDAARQEVSALRGLKSVRAAHAIRAALSRVRGPH